MSCTRRLLTPRSGNRHDTATYGRIARIVELAMFRYGRSVLFPPASLAIVWTITLFAIWLCGDMYFPLTTTANEIVLAGVLAFSLGGICAVKTPYNAGADTHDRSRKAPYTGRSMVDRRGDTLPAEYPVLLSLFQTTERNHCPAGKCVETNSHRVQQGKHIRPGCSFSRVTSSCRS